MLAQVWSGSLVLQHDRAGASKDEWQTGAAGG